jgi:hypothetical protein
MLLRWRLLVMMHLLLRAMRLLCRLASVFGCRRQTHINRLRTLADAVRTAAKGTPSVDGVARRGDGVAQLLPLLIPAGADRMALHLDACRRFCHDARALARRVRGIGMPPRRRS